MESKSQPASESDTPTLKFIVCSECGADNWEPTKRCWICGTVFCLPVEEPNHEPPQKPPQFVQKNWWISNDWSACIVAILIAILVAGGIVVQSPWFAVVFLLIAAVPILGTVATIKLRASVRNDKPALLGVPSVVSKAVVAVVGTLALALLAIVVVVGVVVMLFLLCVAAISQGGPL